MERREDNKFSNNFKTSLILQGRNNTSSPTLKEKSVMSTKSDIMKYLTSKRPTIESNLSRNYRQNLTIEVSDSKLYAVHVI